jgi:hypothetical protein
MTPLEFSQTDGYLPVTLRDPQGNVIAQVALDVYEANNVYVHLSDKYEEANERGAALVEWLKGKGLEVSVGVASVVIDAVIAAADEFKKKFTPPASSPTPASPASTAPPSA